MTATDRRILTASALAAMVVAGAVGALVGARETSQSADSSAPAATLAEPPPETTAPPTPEAIEPSGDWLDRELLEDGVAAVAQETGAAVGVSLSDGDPSQAVSTGDVQTGPAWSTMKVPVVLARLALARERGEPVGAVREVAARALRESDNASAEGLFDELETAEGGVDAASARLEDVLRDAGDADTVVATESPPGGYSTYGQTSWSLSAGLRLFSALAAGCLDGDDESFVLERLRSVTSVQQWGMLSTAPEGTVSTAVKGGWGPGPDGAYLVRQFAVLEGTEAGAVVVALAVRPADGSFGSGVEAIDRLAAAVADAVDVGAAPTPQNC